MVAHLEDARHRLEDARRRLEDALPRLVIPTGIPIAGRRGAMTTAVRQGSARAVIVLTEIDPPATAHRMSGIQTTVFLAIAAPLIGPLATALPVIAHRVTAIQETAHPAIVHSVIVHRVIVFRKTVYPATVRPVIVLPETDPPVTLHRETVPMDVGMALALAPMARGISRDRAPMEAGTSDVMTAGMNAEMTVLRAFQVAPMTMASVPMTAGMTRVRVLQLRVGSVRIDRPKDASVTALSDHQTDTVPAMSVVSRPRGLASASRVPAPSVPLWRPRPKPRHRPQTI